MRVGRVITLAILCVGGAGCSPPPSSAPGRELGAASGKLSHGFSGITSVVELIDGRLLVSDARDRVLLWADFNTDSVAQVSARGDGPLQYTNPGRLFAFHPDSTLQVDLSARRWLFLRGSEIVGQTRPDDPLVVDGSLIFGADRFGRVARLVPPRLTSGGSTIAPTDSLSMVLVSRLTLHHDTVAKLRPTPPMPENVQYQPYFLGEQSFLGADGWLVVVRLDPYRVDWLSPVGEWTRGAPIPARAVAVDPGERNFFGQSTGAADFGDDWQERFQWPETVPPVTFQLDWLLSADGDVLLRRQPHRNTPGSRYDRIDRTGILQEQVLVGAHQRIIALGRNYAYLVSTDADGVEFISRHPWP